MSSMPIALIGLSPRLNALSTLFRHAGATPALIDPQIPNSTLAIQAADLVVIDVDPASLRSVVAELGIGPATRLILAHSGLEPKTGIPLSLVIEEETACLRIGTLAGPLIPSQVSAGLPSALVVASRFAEVNQRLARALHSPACRVYPTLALADTERAGAMVEALGASLGLARALGLGATGSAILMARGATEAARLARRMGGDPSIFAGLAGVGELTAALQVPDHPALLRGDKLARNEADPALADLCEALTRLEPDLPLTRGIGALAAQKISAHELLTQLTERSQRAEGR